MTDKEAEYRTVDEAARILGASPARVRQLLRAGELEGERPKTYVEGVLGPWRIPTYAVRAYGEARVPDDAAATVVLRPGESLAGASPAVPRAEAADAPSDASEILSESVREIREEAERLLAKLERLEGRLEASEIQEFALREGLAKEKERSEALRAELDAERTRRGGGGRGGQRRPFGDRPSGPLRP